MIWILQVFTVNPPLPIILFGMQHVLSSSTDVMFMAVAAKTELLLLLDKPELTSQNSVYQKEGQKEPWITRSFLSPKFPEE